MADAAYVILTRDSRNFTGDLKLCKFFVAIKHSERLYYNIIIGYFYKCRSQYCIIVFVMKQVKHSYLIKLLLK